MPARPFGEDAERALACVFVGPVGLEPTTYGVLVGPSLVTLKVALTCMFVGAWLWLFLPAQPPPVSCSVSCLGPFQVGANRAGLRSDREGRALGGDRLGCWYGSPLHGFEEATDRSGDGWSLRQPGTRRPLPSSAQSKAMSSQAESSALVPDRGAGPHRGAPRRGEAALEPVKKILTESPPVRGSGPGTSFQRFERPGPMQLWGIDIVGGLQLVDPAPGRCGGQDRHRGR